MLRFISCLQASNKEDEVRKREGLSGDELKKAENEWVKVAQTTLRRQRNFEQLVKEFNLTEVEGILKCGGRLRNSDLDPLAQRPVILPKDHEFTKLVIEDCHNRVYHSGVRATLTELR